MGNPWNLLSFPFFPKLLPLSNQSFRAFMQLSAYHVESFFGRRPPHGFAFLRFHNSRLLMFRKNRHKAHVTDTLSAPEHFGNIVGTDEIPEKFYAMTTLSKKAGQNFKAAKIRQFSQWLFG